MNDALQTELASFLSSLRHAASDASGFVLEQAPLVIQEAVTLARLESLLVLAVFLVGMVSVALVIREASSKRCFGFSDRDDRFMMQGIAAVVCGLGALILLIWASVHVHGGLQAWFAPRVYVLDYIAGLVRK